MKRRVNLYQTVLQPVQEKAGLALLLRMLLLVLLLLAGIWSWLQWQQQQQQQQLALLQQEQQSSLQQLEVLQQTLAQRQPSAELRRQAEQLQRSISQKQQLLAYLQQQNNGQAPTYAAVMAHLAQIDPTGLWLTGFSLGEHLYFHGVVRQSQLLPRWMQALGQHPQLQGLTLATVRLTPLQNTSAVVSDTDAISIQDAAAEQGWLSFVISTAATEAGPQNASGPEVMSPSSVAPSSVAPLQVAPSSVAPSSVAPSSVAPRTDPRAVIKAAGGQ